MAGVWIFTDNTDFVGGRTREQDPIVAIAGPSHLQVHAPAVAGRRCQLLYRGAHDDRRQARTSTSSAIRAIGATFSSAISRRQAIRVSVSRGAYTTIGADFTSIAVGYNFAWAR